MQTWEYNVLKLNPPNSHKLCFVTGFIEQYANHLDGDYAEFGVFKGASFITISHLISTLNLNVNKTCWAFDTFDGFPEDLRIDPRDDPKLFADLFFQKRITKGHLSAVKRLQQLRQYQAGIINKDRELSHQELSTSKNFEVDDSINLIKNIAHFLNLDNIKLIEGEFAQSLAHSVNLPEKIFCALLDVDLYQSYEDVLSNIWHRVVPFGRIYLDEYYSLKFPGPRYYVDKFVGLNPDCKLKLAGRSGDFERWYIEKSA